MRPILRTLLLILALAPPTAFALDQVTLQLKWHHQFQFAGYYAAKELGYYREAGLDVTILPVSPTRNPIDVVLLGEAQYGVGSSNLLLERNAGKPFVVLGVIFQHSPYVLLAMERNGIQSVHDLAGKKVMIEPYATEILAYLKASGVSPEQLVRIPSYDYSAQDLLSGKVDAYAGYSTNDPFYLDQARARYFSFNPRSEGIDFYGDNLYTTESEIEANPQRVARFLEASLRGWRYAAKHPEQVADLMIAKGYFPADDRDKLLFEAAKTIELMHPEMIEVGHMHASRWQHIVDTYVDLGMLPRGFSLEGFLYNPRPAQLPGWAWWALVALLLIALLASGLSAMLYDRYQQLFSRLFQTRSRYESILGRLPLAVFELHMQGDRSCRLSSASPTFGRLFDIDPQPLHKDAAPLLERVVAEDRAPLLAAAGASARDLAPFQMDFRIHTSTRQRWLLASAIPEAEADGTVIWSGFVTDITENKQLELDRIEAARLFNAVFENAGVGIAQVSVDGLLMQVNREFCRIIGYSREEVAASQLTFQRITLPDDLAQDMRQLQVLLDGQAAHYSMEKRYVRKDGAIIWVSLAVQLLRDEQGQPLYFVSTIHDITEQKNAELHLRESEQSFRALADSSPVPMALNDDRQNIVYLNPAFSSTFGYRQEELPTLGYWWPKAYPDPQYRQWVVDTWRARMERAAQLGLPFEPLEVEITCKDGRARTVIASATELNRSGESPQHLVILFDITERKEAERELEHYRQHLEELVQARTAEANHAREVAVQANQAKSAFLSNMSHELRTPLHSILSFSNLGLEHLEAGDLDQGKSTKYFTRVAESGERLLLLINDLLDLSKLESGKIELRLEAHDLRALTESVCNELEALRLAKRLQLDLDGLPQQLPALCDGFRIAQVIRNLISNAIKYSPAEGTITLGAEITGAGATDNPPSVLFKVQDVGIGIPEAELESIFDEFVQSSKTTTNAGGTGLGLSICRQIILLHGGRIHAVNNPDRGATFVFSLPLKPPA